MSESLFNRGLRRLGPARLMDQLRSVRLTDFAPDVPEEFQGLTAFDCLDDLWELHARPEQLAPGGDWTVWGVVAGRGYGKTRLAAQWVVGIAEEAAREVAAGRLRVEAARILVIAPTASDLRDVAVEGVGGMLRCSPRWFPAHYEPSKRRVTWPGGVEATLISADEADRIRGVQGIAAWLDEAAVYPKLEDVMSNVRFAVRLGDRPRILVTTTPRRRKALRDLLAAPGTVVTHGSTRENADNLAKGVVDSLEAQFAGSRLGRQELMGEILDDAEGALWRMEWIDATRLSSAPELRRVVVAIDPAGGSNRTNDETGIIVAGVGKCGCKGTEQDHGFVLADLSGRMSPENWARAAINAYESFRADRIVAEANFGGAMVEATLRAVSSSVPYQAVTASRGKQLRAEPIAAQYERGTIHHVGTFARLEDQMCEWSPLIAAPSPDRLDAAVWALSALSPRGAACRHSPPPKVTGNRWRI